MVFAHNQVHIAPVAALDELEDMRLSQIVDNQVHNVPAASLDELEDLRMSQSIRPFPRSNSIVVRGAWNESMR